MSFSLGFDDVLPTNSSQSSPFHPSSGDSFLDYGASFGASFGGSGSIPSGEEAMSTAFTRGSSVTSASQDLKDMLDSNKDGLKVLKLTNTLLYSLIDTLSVYSMPSLSRWSNFYTFQIIFHT